MLQHLRDAQVAARLSKHAQLLLRQWCTRTYNGEMLQSAALRRIG